jgi:hypothetical protein
MKKDMKKSHEKDPQAYVLIKFFSKGGKESDK